MAGATRVGAYPPAAWAASSAGGRRGDARTELIKLAVRKIVEEALEAEVSEVAALLPASRAPAALGLN